MLNFQPETHRLKSVYQRVFGYWRHYDAERVSKAQFHYNANETEEIKTLMKSLEESRTEVHDKAIAACLAWLKRPRQFTKKADFWELRFRAKTFTKTPLEYLYDRPGERAKLAELKACSDTELVNHRSFDWIFDAFLDHRIRPAVKAAWNGREAPWAENDREFPYQTVYRNELNIEGCNHVEIREFLSGKFDHPDRVLRAMRITGDGGCTLSGIDQLALVGSAEYRIMIQSSVFKHLIDSICDISKDFTL